jgi:hypothetical protein
MVTVKEKATAKEEVRYIVYKEKAPQVRGFFFIAF